MNYQHAFHAGNFADLFKHALLVALLADFRRSAQPFNVIDSHAGEGVYDLEGEEARRTGEGAAAVQLMSARDVPAALRPLRQAIERLNHGRPLRFYPGSPWLVGDALRGGDRGLACEMNPAAASELRRALASYRRLEIVAGDGWATATRRAAPAPAPLLVLIDPPFEAGDDGARAVEALGRILSRNGSAIVAVWAPLKDLASFDALASDLEDAAGDRPVLVAELRLRALADPMRMNGCAMIVVNPPIGLAETAREAGRWIVSTLGEPGRAIEVRESA
ncbi:MAG: 23S rRNA (adenine(2030)-N(6))-methyltransferase RlmJ [Caulobacteraceae bacterium]|nr:23S rRNA (adenine(2030)-N(6))-methyltransferase RlmJ [Caulobacteraceae bacterium]